MTATWHCDVCRPTTISTSTNGRRRTPTGFRRSSFCRSGTSNCASLNCDALWPRAPKVSASSKARGAPLGLPSFHTNYWDPLFSLAEDADIPFMMHIGTSGTSPMTAPDAPEATFFALIGLNSMQAMINLCFSPVFHRHPKLKIVLAEGGIGWLPWMLERADTTWERQRFWQNINQEVKPSELFRRNIWCCFITDRAGIGLRHDIGLDRILWECNSPHSDSMWPNSRKVLAEAVRDVPDDEVHVIAELTARELFHLKPA